MTVTALERYPITELKRTPADFAPPKAVACKRADGQGPCNRGGACNIQNKCLAVDGSTYERKAAEVSIDFKELEDALTRNRLAEIATLVRALTYGEMMELAKAIWTIRPNEVEPLTEDTLPGVLHRWSESR